MATIRLITLTAKTLLLQTDLRGFYMDNTLICITTMLAVGGFVGFFIGRKNSPILDPMQEHKLNTYESLNQEKESLRKEKDELNIKLLDSMKIVGKVTELESLKISSTVKIDSLEKINKEQQIIISQMENRKIELDTIQKNLEKENMRLQEEKDTLLKTYKAEFENIANNILSQQTNKFKDMNKGELAHIITPLHQTLEDFKKKVDEYRLAQSEDKVNFNNQINNVIETKVNLENITKDFVNSLRGESTIRGAWGEDTLRAMLDASGLKKDINYFEQFNDDAGKRPDFIVKLPNDKMIVIDAKTVFNNYDKYMNEKDLNKKQDYLLAHVEDIKKTISNLGTVKYKTSAQKLCKKLGLPEDTDPIDYVLMWVNPESAIISAVKEDVEIIKYAYDKRVALVSGSSLMTTLKMIDILWSNHEAQEKGEAIKDAADYLVSQFGSFLSSFLEVKDHLNKALSAHTKATNIVGENNRVGLIGKAQELANIYENKISNGDIRMIKRMGYSFDGKKQNMEILTSSQANQELKPVSIQNESQQSD